MFYFLLKILLGPLVRLIWVKKVTGLNNIPQSKVPLIIAANHSSYFDFIVLVATFPYRIRFLAAEVFYESLFWRPIMIFTGQIKVDRRKKDKSNVFKAVSDNLKKGRVIGIFPEGTRSRTGQLQRAYAGVAKFALKNKTNILPVAITGAYNVMSPHDKFPKFKKAIKIKYLPQLIYEDFKNYSPEYITHRLLMSKIAKEINQKYPEAK